MQIRWSPDDAADLGDIVGYIRDDSPDAAQRVAQTIYDRAGVLRNLSYSGRVGRVDGTRELPLPPSTARSAGHHRARDLVQQEA